MNNMRLDGEAAILVLSSCLQRISAGHLSPARTALAQENARPEEGQVCVQHGTLLLRKLAGRRGRQQAGRGEGGGCRGARARTRQVRGCRPEQPGFWLGQV